MPRSISRQLPARLQWSPHLCPSPRLRLQRAARRQRRSRSRSRKRRWCGSQRLAQSITGGQTAATQKAPRRCQSAGLLQWAWNHVSAATKTKRTPRSCGNRTAGQQTGSPQRGSSHSPSNTVSIPLFGWVCQPIPKRRYFLWRPLKNGARATASQWRPALGWTGGRYAAGRSGRPTPS